MLYTGYRRPSKTPKRPPKQVNVYFKFQGARQVRRSGMKAVFVFIAPPSEEELERRIRGRATDSEDQIRIRLKQAAVEMER